jgi:hypothetical protein
MQMTSPDDALLSERHITEWRDALLAAGINPLVVNPLCELAMQSLRRGEGEAVAEKDEAYRQRNYLVAALAKLFPSGIRKTDIPGWSDDWHGCCFIDLPSGQISYHFHDSHAHLFVGLPDYATPWDGHDKETVHARLLSIRALLPERANETAAGRRGYGEEILIESAAPQENPND